MADVVPQSGHGGSVDVHIDGQVAVVTLRRGKNQFNFEMCEAFGKALDKVERNPGVTILVTTSEGKFFSNGLDSDLMAAVSKTEPELIRTNFLKEYYKLICRILTFPMPAIAAINGHTFGAGAVFALAHDYSIMQTGRGWWCIPGIFVNARFAPIILALIRTKMTPVQIRESVIFGSRFTAEKAKAIGIVDQVAPSGELMKVTKAFASELASSPYPRESLFNMKSDVWKDILKEMPNTSSNFQSNL